MSDQLLVWLAVGAVLVGIVAFAVAAVALAAVSRVRAASGRRGTAVGIDGRDGEIAQLRHQLDEQAAERAELRRALRAAVSRTATIRYDAFRESGGQLSSSTALLDAQGNGVVLTSINGRSESRTYAKSVTRGDSHTPLSEEETEAVRLAMSRPHAEADHAAGVAADPHAVRAGVLIPAARASRSRRGRRSRPKTVL